MSTRRRGTGRNGTKTHYSEHEVAALLNVTVEQLRELVKRHILKESEDAASQVIPIYHTSDLVLLRILTTMPGTLTRTASAG